MPPRDPKALAKAMARLAASPDDRMGAAGRPEVYSWPQVYEMAVEAYGKALSRRSRA